MFSMQDLIKMMGPNTASYIQMSDQLGTLEPGKLADIILLDGESAGRLLELAENQSGGQGRRGRGR